MTRGHSPATVRARFFKVLAALLRAKCTILKKNRGCREFPTQPRHTCRKNRALLLASREVLL
jgi:hypothetical protein